MLLPVPVKENRIKKEAHGATIDKKRVVDR